VIAPFTLGPEQADAVRAARRAVYGAVLQDWTPQDSGETGRDAERLNEALGRLHANAASLKRDAAFGAGADQVEEASVSGAVRLLSSRGSPSSAK
jgi:predicted trehalose synthase